MHKHDNKQTDTPSRQTLPRPRHHAARPPPTRNARARHDSRTVPSRAHICQRRMRLQTKPGTRQKQGIETKHTNEHTFTTNTLTNARPCSKPLSTERPHTTRHTPPHISRAHIDDVRDHTGKTRNASQRGKIHGNRRVVLTRGTGHATRQYRIDIQHTTHNSR